MFDCRQDEKTFWKTMNPMRLRALFDAHFRPARKVSPTDHNSPQANKPSGSLAAYLTGG